MRKNGSIGSGIFFVIFVLGVLQSFGENVKEPAITLVKNGKATAEIIIPANPLSSVKVAAEDLQAYLEKISGAQLPITTKPSDDVENHVYVGKSEYTKKLGVTTDDLKVEGFKIIAKDHNLILVGHDKHHPPFPYSRQELEKWRKFTGKNYGSVPTGVAPVQNTKLGFSPLDATATLYAVSEFLEQLGVRWYMPYENGSVVPNKNTIAVPEQSIKKEPRFPYRDLWRCGLRFDSEGVLWNKHLKYGASYVYYCNHTTPAIMRLNPEFRAIAGGKPIPGHKNIGMSRLCDPNFRKASMNYLEKILDAYPPLMGMSLGMPDGLGQIDERDAERWPPQHGLQDKGLHHFSNKFSNYVWDYWLYAAKELKKSHPGKYLTCLGYPPYFEPPPQVDKLPENVTLQLCYWTTNLILPEGKHLERIRDQWIAKLSSKKMFTWDYFLFYYGNGPKYPVAFTKLLQKEMQKLDGVCEGKFIETQSDYQPPWRITCPGLTHLLYYLQAKLFWNPDLDLDHLLNEYYALYFGPAKAEMKEFYEFAEEVWMRPEPRSISRVGGFLKEKDVDCYFDILKRAREKAGKDTVYDKRIVQIENEMEPLRKLFVNLKRVGPEFVGFTTGAPVKIDGDLTKPFWNDVNNWLEMRELITGKRPRKNKTAVSFRMTKDKELIVGVVCHESKMDKLMAKTTDNDAADIFNDDALEIYLETPERSYFKIVVNANGAVWDESQDATVIQQYTLPGLWDPGVQAAVKRYPDRWTAEILIPTRDFGSLGPSKAYPWGVNVCRTRLAGGTPQNYAISPTGKSCYLDLAKLGNLWFR